MSLSPDVVRLRDQMLAIDLKEFIRKKYGLSFSGAKCKSPWRNERTGSFHVYEKAGQYSFYDFGGGGVSGDIFTLLEKTDGLSFVEAFNKLCEEELNVATPFNGVHKEPTSEAIELELRKARERPRVEAVLEQATAYYQSALLEKPDLIEWLKDNWGIGEEDIRRNRIGYCDGGCAHYMKSFSLFDDAEMLLSGLFNGNKDGVTDAFSGRLFFPYVIGGKVAYSIARQTKYTDTNSEFEKGKYKKQYVWRYERAWISPCLINRLYGEDDLQKQSQYLLIVEGVTDTIVARREGYTCVSPITSKLSGENVEQIVRYKKNFSSVVFVGDSDPKKDGTWPGLEGALQSGLKLFARGISVEIGIIPVRADGEKEDVCSLIRDQGGEALGRVLEKRRSFFDVYTEHLPVEVGKRAKAIEELIDSFAVWSDAAVGQYMPSLERVSGLVKSVIKKKITERRKELRAERESLQYAGVPQKGDVIVQDGVYMEEVQDHKGNVTKQAVSSFTLRLKRVLVSDEDKRLQCDVVLADGSIAAKEIVFAPQSWSSRNQFIRSIGFDPRLSFTGNDNQVQGIQRLLVSQDAPVLAGTMVIGYVETLKKEPRWVWTDGTLSPDGVMEDPDVYFAGARFRGAAFRRILRYPEAQLDEIKSVAKEAHSLLYQLNMPHIVYALLSWFYASPFASRVRETVGSFPHLMVTGGPGSGKTTTVVQCMWAMFGIHGNPITAFGINDTEFSLINKIADTNGVPVCFDEYRSDQGVRAVERFDLLLRKAYSGEIKERGKADLSLEMYRLQAPIAVTGETLPEDPALCERIFACEMERAEVDRRRDSSQRCVHRLLRMPLQVLALPYVKWSLSQDVGAMIERARDDVEKCGIRNLPPRIIQTMSVIRMGMIAMETYLETLGVELPSVTLFQVLSAGLRALEEEQVLALTEAGAVGKRPADALDRFLQDMSDLSRNGDLEIPTHYHMKDGELFVHLRSSYARYREAKMRRQEQVPSLREIRQAIKTNLARQEYVIDQHRNVKVGTNVVRHLVVSLGRLPPWLDISFGDGSTLKAMYRG